MAPARKPLTMEDREDISRGLAKGLENKDIAASIGRDESVVSREIARHGGREAYRAWKVGVLGFRKPSEVFTELMLQEAVIPPA